MIIDRVAAPYLLKLNCQLIAMTVALRLYWSPPAANDPRDKEVCVVKCSSRLLCSTSQAGTARSSRSKTFRLRFMPASMVARIMQLAPVKIENRSTQIKSVAACTPPVHV